MKFRAIISHTKAATMAAVVAVALAACEGEDGRFDVEMEAALAANDYPTVMALWRDKADAGDARAHVQIGALFERGLGVVQNYSRAADEYRAAVELRDAAAMVSLGILYERGLGVDRDPQQSLALYTQAADLGDPSAQYRAGRLYDGSALGTDYAKALAWYRLAAERGFVDAQMELANHYFSGLRVPRDPVKAAKWYRMAAELGNLEAQFRLGFLYEKGSGLPQSDIEAYAWYRLSAAQGDAAAIENLARLGPSLDPGVLEAAKALSLQYWDLYAAPFQTGA